MNIKQLLFALTYFVFGFICFFVYKNSKKSSSPETTRHHLVDMYDSYYFPIPVLKFRNTGLPCIPLEVEGETISGLLDLGTPGPLSLSSECLSHIVNKTQLDTGMACGINGIICEEIRYLIPSIHISSLCYSAIAVREKNPQCDDQSYWNQDGGPSPAPEPGTIGWEMFSKSNLFLDLANSTLAACDSLETLKTRGYFTGTFLKVPLLKDKSLIECEGELLGKSTRFVLDTGSTWNIINTPLKEGESIETMVWDPAVSFDSF